MISNKTKHNTALVVHIKNCKRRNINSKRAIQIVEHIAENAMPKNDNENRKKTLFIAIRDMT